MPLYASTCAIALAECVCFAICAHSLCRQRISSSANIWRHTERNRCQELTHNNTTNTAPHTWSTLPESIPTSAQLTSDGERSCLSSPSAFSSWPGWPSLWRRLHLFTGMTDVRVRIGEREGQGKRTAHISLSSWLARVTASFTNKVRMLYKRNFSNPFTKYNQN